MKSKKTVFLTIGLIILFSLTSYAETKKLKRVGRNTLVRIRGEVPVAEVMKTIIEKYLGDIKYGFDLVGYGDLYLPFVDQIKAAAFEEKELPIGDKIMWMLYRARGRVKVTEDIEWAGKAPLPVFSFTVVKGYNHYEFIMPKPCGNIALRGITEVIPDAVCAIKVEPAKANINEPISVDMSESQEAKSMEVEVFDKNGNKVDSKKLTPDSPKWQTRFAKPGEYVFKGKAFNVKDKPSENPCEAKTYINFPPVSKVTCSPNEEYAKVSVNSDAMGSSDPDGEIVKVDFEIKDEGGRVVDTFSDTEKPFAWEKLFDKEGVFTITATATDDFGAVSDPASDKIKVHKRWFGVFDLSGYSLGARIGGLCKEPLKWQKTHLIVSAGVAYDYSGNTYFLANGIINFDSRPRFSDDPGFFIGGGLGFSLAISGNQGFDPQLIVDLGYHLGKKFTIFAEVRALTNFVGLAGLRILL